MSDYEAKALEYFEATWVKENRKGRVEHLAAFGRDCAASAYEDAAKMEGKRLHNEHCCRAKRLGLEKHENCLWSDLHDKAHALRQPISVTQEEEGK